MKTNLKNNLKDNRLIYLVTGVALAAALGGALIVNNNLNHTDSLTSVGSLDIDNGDLKINWANYSEQTINLADSLTITESGIYHLTGTLDGNITIKVASGAVRLILDNVAIKSSSGPAIACYSADDLVIELVGESTLSDGSSYAGYDEDVAGAIYSKSDLTFEGDGILNLTANYQDGIVGKDDLKFNSGTYNITAKDDGIRGKDSVYIVDGTFNIIAKADGIKSTNDTDAGKGFVLVENGNITIAAGDDGIHGENKLLIEDGDINITKSYEGLEAVVIAINGGNIKIVSSDDGINAGGGSGSTTTSNQRGMMMDADSSCVLTINGGDIYINASGDGVDSNGYINFAGGTVIVDGPTDNGNGALDSGISITQTGGTVIAVGSSGMAETLGANSSINSASIYFASTNPAGTVVTIKDSAGNTIIEHTSAKTFSHMAVGTADFKAGETYTVYVNSTAYQTFTVSSTVTTVGKSTNNFNNNFRR